MSVTAWLLIVFAHLLVFVDLWLAVAYGHEYTISAELDNQARSHPIIPFAFGILMGHFFWR